MTTHPDLFAALAAPFADAQVRTRKHDGARYITARSVMNRLDSTVGPENWNACYEGWSEDAVLCRLSITLPDGKVITKCDVGSYTKLSETNRSADAGDDDKGGFSDSLKRAAVLFGIGRWLYGDGVPSYTAGESPWPPVKEPVPSPGYSPPAASNGNGNGNGNGQHHHKERHEWGTAAGPAVIPRANGSTPRGHAAATGTAPKTGRALFAWCKDMEERHQIGMLRYVNGWAKLQDFPGRMIDWDGEQVALAYAEAVRKLGTDAGRNGEGGDS